MTKKNLETARAMVTKEGMTVLLAYIAVFLKKWGMPPREAQGSVKGGAFDRGNMLLYFL